MNLDPDDVRIRTRLRSGDLGYVVYLHGVLYAREYGYGLQFESYVASGIHEFYESYDPLKDRVWLCEHDGATIGSLFLMHRGEDLAQLRYFLLAPEYRGIGLGKRLMTLLMDFAAGCGYHRAYLWTTHELATAASLYRRHGFALTEDKASTGFGKPLREQRYDAVLGSP